MKSATLTALRKAALQPGAEDELQLLINDLLAEVGDAMLSLVEDQHLSRYIGFVQVSCTETMNQVTAAFKGKVAELHFQNLALQNLSMLLGHLRNYYPQFYNHNAPMPLFMTGQWKETLEKNCKIMYAKLKPKMRDTLLLEIIDTNFKTVMGFGSYTRDEVGRHADLIDFIIEFSNHTSTSGFDRQLMNLLVALDFRNTSFIDHYKFQIYADCDVEHGLEAQRNVLRRYRYELSKLSLSRYSNVIERNQTFEILSTSVTELLEHKSDVSGGVGIGTPLKAVAQIGGYRLKTSFSVDVLAYLTKLYVDCGYLQTAAKTDLFNFLAARVETSNSGDAALSAGSIKNKYNQVVTSTATKTRAMLTKMIGQIDLEFK